MMCLWIFIVADIRLVGDAINRARTAITPLKNGYFVRDD